MLSKLTAATAGLTLAFSLSGGHVGREQILHSFQGGSTDGSLPSDSLVLDAAGNLYGTTVNGGNMNCTFGCGTVFRLTPSGSETILHAFSGGNDGDGPVAGLLMDKAGNFYGTTASGGSANKGTLFELTSAGTETILYAFQGGGTDGVFPNSTPVMDADGNIYGTTEVGGNTCREVGCGTVYKVVPGGTETVLHAFADKNGDGWYPQGVIRGGKRDLYGATENGGQRGCEATDCGIVFKITVDGKESVVHSFSSAEGWSPRAGLVADRAGNLYGTTFLGGNYTNCDAGCGTVFKIAADGTESVLHSFSGNDGANPDGAMIIDGKGNLYGTTQNGGNDGFGTVFELAANGTETVLYYFRGGSDGEMPAAAPTASGPHILYGTTFEGGTGDCSEEEESGCGTVYTIRH